MTKHLKSGQAQIIQTGPRAFILTYISTTNFSKGERTYSNEQEAREFCAERGIRVL